MKPINEVFLMKSGAQSPQILGAQSPTRAYLHGMYSRHITYMCTLLAFASVVTATGCSSGSGLIGSPLGTHQDIAVDAWQQALLSSEDKMKRSAIRLADSLRLESEADEAEARGDAATASEARDQAQQALRDATALENDAQREINLVRDRLTVLKSEQDMLQKQLDDIAQASDPLTSQLRVKLAEKQAISNQIQAALDRIKPLQNQIAEIRVMLELRAPPPVVNRRIGVGVGLWRNDPATGKPLYDFLLDQFTSVMDLHIGWYIDWGAGQYEGYKRERRVDYMPLVQGWSGAPPSVDTVKTLVNNNPERYPDGTLWMAGNEIGWDDARSPTRYVKAYCQAYQAIKAVNPTFQVSPGAIIPTSFLYFNETHAYKPGSPLSMVTNPDGTQYEDQWRRYNNKFSGLDFFKEVMDRYRTGVGRNWNTGAEERFTECDALRTKSATFPADAWLIHVYPMHDNMITVPSSEPVSDVYKSLEIVRRVRTLMRDYGARNVPLYIKEMGPSNLSGEQGGAVGPGGGNPLWYNKQYLERTFDNFNAATDANIGMPADGNRLIQRWAWFVLNNVTTAQGGNDGWMSIALFDSITKQKIVHDSSSQGKLADAFAAKTATLADAPAMYNMSMSGGNFGGVFQRLWISPEREGKTVHFQAAASCSGDAKFFGWYITRYRRSDGAKLIADTDPTKMKRHLGVCDGRWRKLDLDVVIPSDTRELEAFVMLQSNTAAAQGAVRDARAELDMTNSAGAVVKQELIQNGSFGLGSNMSGSMNKPSPEPWYLWANAQNAQTWGKVVPWKARPF